MFNKTELANKLKIITEEIPHVRSISCGIWIKGGSVQEEKAESGITHFVEHMMFKGTKKRTARDIADEIESVGGFLNAGTGKEYICIFSRILSAHIDRAVEVMADIILNSTYSEIEVEKEKNVILEEIKMYEDNPQELIYDLFYQTAFSQYRLGRRIIGTRDTVHSINQEKIVDHVKKFYNSSGMIVAAAGHLKHEEFVSKIVKHFKNIKNENGKYFSQKADIKSSYTVKKKDLEQVHLCLGTKGLAQGYKDEYVMTVLNTILGGGMSSRLFQKIREDKGLVYSIYSFQSSYSNCGMLGVYAGCSQKNLDRVIKLIAKELNLIKNKVVSKGELSRAKEHMKGDLMLALESTSNRMLKIGRNEFYLKREVTLDEILNEIDKVKTEDIANLTEQLIKNDYIVLSILGNVEEGKAGNYKEIIGNIIN